MPDDRPTSRRELRAAERTRQRAAEEAARREAELRAEQERAAQQPEPTSAQEAQDPGAEPPRPEASERGTGAAPGPDGGTGPPDGEPVRPADEATGEAAAGADEEARDEAGENGAGSASATAEHPHPATAAPAAGDRRTPAEANDPFSQIFGTEDDPRAERVGRPVRERGQRRRGPRIGGIVVVLVALLAIGGAGLAGWSFFGERIQEVLGLRDDDFEGEGDGTEVQFTILPGDTGTDVGVRLAEAGIVKTSDAFVRAILARPEEPSFIPGTYTMEQRMSSASALVRLLDDSNRMEHTVMIPEGTVAADVFVLVERSLDIPVAELEEAAADPQSFGLPEEADSLEGFLFPATYTFEPDVDARTVLETMVARMDQALAEHGVAAEDRWDVIRLAALVEKEARLPDDFPKVARVFLNRIDEGMLLQSDATVTYDTGNTHRVTTTDDERANADNPYNTYVHPGLPIGPISNPGDRAIDAAVNPADGPWLYFVSVNLDTGETVFSETYEQHLEAVDRWLAWMEENPGWDE
ncbi:MAG: endolytic transglycosylase MltG [Microbacteriaceae bacterium]|nr:endolytic transglycosylase MltG [Microbacteriaceae bacterium]